MAQKGDEMAPLTSRVLNFVKGFAGGAAAIAFVNIAPIAGNNKPMPMDLGAWFAISAEAVFAGAVLGAILSWYLSRQKPPGSESGE
jgi:membrane associated rhomboid family serine protease